MWKNFLLHNKNNPVHYYTARYPRFCWRRGLNQNPTFFLPKLYNMQHPMCCINWCIFEMHHNCSYILFTKLPWTGDSEGAFWSSSQAPTSPPVYHTRRTVEASHCPFNCRTSGREAVNPNFYSLWLDPNRNWTHVYCFSSRHSIYLTTNR